MLNEESGTKRSGLTDRMEVMRNGYKTIKTGRASLVLKPVFILVYSLFQSKFMMRYIMVISSFSHDS